LWEIAHLPSTCPAFQDLLLLTPPTHGAHAAPGKWAPPSLAVQSEGPGLLVAAANLDPNPYFNLVACPAPLTTKGPFHFALSFPLATERRCTQGASRVPASERERARVDFPLLISPSPPTPLPGSRPSSSPSPAPTRLNCAAPARSAATSTKKVPRILPTLDPRTYQGLRLADHISGFTP